MDRKSQRTTIGQKARHDHLAWSEDTPEHILRRIPTYWPQYREHARAVMSARGREVVRQFYNCAAPFFGILSSLVFVSGFQIILESTYDSEKVTSVLADVHTSKMKYFQLETFILYAGVRIELDR
uniref:SFRICE_012490 n=1 Tax=Spodoptera frugiperda TaxID=7108 RepID=A0A2H1WZ51_SPOFR